jgi:hypothetical protein
MCKVLGLGQPTFCGGATLYTSYFSRLGRQVDFSHSSWDSRYMEIQFSLIIVAMTGRACRKLEKNFTLL